MTTHLAWVTKEKGFLWLMIAEVPVCGCFRPVWTYIVTLGSNLLRKDLTVSREDVLGMWW